MPTSETPSTLMCVYHVRVTGLSRRALLSTLVTYEELEEGS